MCIIGERRIAVNKRRILSFLGLTFLINWAIIGIFLALGGSYKGFSVYIIGTIYMLIPGFVAFILQRLVYKENATNSLGISFKINRWFFVAWLLPVIIAFCSLGVSLLFPGVEYTPDMAGMIERIGDSLSQEQLELMKSQIENSPINPIWITLIQGLIAGVTINAVFGFGEELGWRGFLLRELKIVGFWKSSVLIGFIWGIWHAPIILMGHNYPEHPVLGVFMMIIWCILLSPMFSYITIKAKSVIAASILHGTLNGTVGISFMLIKGGNDLTVGATGLAGFIVLILINLGIFLYDRCITNKPIEEGIEAF